nr:unnamed protein product [Digitaria exilis]
MWSSLPRMAEIASSGSAAQSLASSVFRPRLRRRRRLDEEVDGGGIEARAWGSDGLGFGGYRRGAGSSQRAKSAGGGSRGSATGAPARSTAAASGRRSSLREKTAGAGSLSAAA